jgi:hypothetical protein
MQRQFAIAVLTVGLFAVTSSGVRGAGTNAADEAAIRKLITAGDQGTAMRPMPDRIFWSGAYKRPRIAPEKGDPRTDVAGGMPDRVPGTQKSKTDVIRIVIADSRDLAYEYSKATADFDVKSGGHMSFETGALRVWQKQGGEWKVAANFDFRYDTP